MIMRSTLPLLFIFVFLVGARAHYAARAEQRRLVYTGCLCGVAVVVRPFRFKSNRVEITIIVVALICSHFNTNFLPDQRALSRRAIPSTFILLHNRYCCVRSGQKQKEGHTETSIKRNEKG